MHRPQRVGFGARQRVASRPKAGYLRNLSKSLAIIGAVAVLLGLLVTQLVHYQAGKASLRIEQLQAEGQRAGNLNVQLLAERARLTSKAHLLAVTGKRLGLRIPDKGQVHRM